MDEHQKKLVDYINSQLQKGIGKDVIVNSLLGSGWTKDRIDEAFRSISDPVPQFVPSNLKSEISSVSDNKYKGLGGWMILFIILLCIGIYRELYFFYDTVLYWIGYFRGTLLPEALGVQVGYHIEILLAGLIILPLSFYVLSLIFNKKRKAVKWALILLGIGVLDNLIFNALSFYMGVGFLEVFGSVAAGILVPFIAWRYIVSSKRVKATFVDGSKKNRWWIPLAFGLVIAATAPYLILIVGVSHTLNSASDAQRVSDVESLKRVLGDYYAQHQSYPTSLSSLLNEPNPEISRIPQDPNGVPYSYTSDGPTYELCANTEGDSVGNLTFTNRRYCVTSEPSGPKKITSLIPPELEVYLVDYYQAHGRFPDLLADLKNPPINIDLTSIKNVQYTVLDGGKSYQFSTKDPSGKTLCYGPDSFFEIPCK